MSVARKCYSSLGLSFPAVVDDMGDKVAKTYAGSPDRLYIVDRNGKIVYKGKRGPGGFDLAEMVQALEKICNSEQ